MIIIEGLAFALAFVAFIWAVAAEDQYRTGDDVEAKLFPADEFSSAIVYTSETPGLTDSYSIATGD
jgi:hypothetical protein